MSMLAGDAKCCVMSMLAGYRLLCDVPVSWVSLLCDVYVSWVSSVA